MGQRRIASISAEVRGPSLAAEVCALYLAGAGVRRLLVDGALLERVRAVNREVEVEALANDAPELTVRMVAPIDVEHVEQGDDPVLVGSRAARWVLAKGLGATS